MEEIMVKEFIEEMRESIGKLEETYIQSPYQMKMMTQK